MRQCRRNSLGSFSIAPWVRAAGLGLAIVGLFAGAAQAQAVTEFSTGISANAEPVGITAGPDGNLWFTEESANVNRIGEWQP